VALGVWQVQRLSWKLDLIERVDQRLKAPPQPLPPPVQWPEVTAAAYEYQPVRLQGQWLADKTVLTQATTALGAGYWVLTPLQTSEGTQVLVNRGFVPQDQRARWQGGAGADTSASAPATVVGLLRMSEPGGGGCGGLGEHGLVGQPLALQAHGLVFICRSRHFRPLHRRG
jgi:surfeit locus 1 family protein